MPPHGWTTKEQKEFLNEELKEYIKIGSRKYRKNWTTLFQKWAQHWPERQTALPNIPADHALTVDQDALLAKAWEKRQEVSILLVTAS